MIGLRQQTTHRIDRCIDSTVTCYARDESGRIDLSATDLSVTVRPYGRQNTLATLAASGDANGVISFVVPRAVFAVGGPGFDYGYGLRYQPRNLARFDVIASGALVYQALLEIA